MTKKCFQEGCDKPAFSVGLCQSCYMKAYRNKNRGECSVNDCDRPLHAKRVCLTHYERLRRFGTYDLPDRETLTDPCKWPACPEMTTRSFCKKHQPLFNRIQRHGMTPDRLNHLITKQSNRCLVCLTDFNDLITSKNGTGFVVDHDHACCSGLRGCANCIRGLLCDDCNQMLGKAKDDVNTLARGVMYLNGSL